MGKALKRTARPTTPHATWGAPQIVTHETRDCTSPPCMLGPEWSGENLYSGGVERCRPAPHWDAILAEAEKRGLPKAYRRDLYVHDRAHAAQLDSAEPFLWILRENGTHLLPLDYVDGVKHDIVHFAVSIPKIFASEELHVYVWDGRYLKEHRTPEDAADALRTMKKRKARRMDPQACLQRWRDATDREERAEAETDLVTWLARGGFEPRWTTPEERERFTGKR